MKPSQELYETLETAYDYFNEHLFDDTLPNSLFSLQGKSGSKGYFQADSSLIEVFQWIVHEQVHCFQKLYGSPSRGGYHNKEFAKKMVSIGLMPSSTGRPGGKRTGQSMADYPIPGGQFVKASLSLINLRELSIKDVLVRRFDPIVYELFGELNEKDQAAAEMLMTSMVNLFPTSFSNEEKKTKKKTKYCCPGCDANLWGKPALEIVCKPCDLIFDEICA